MDLIDLSNVPSAMETMARGWGASVTPRPPALPRSTAKPAAPALPPRLASRRPFAEAADAGQAGFFGSDPAVRAQPVGDRPEAAARAKGDAIRAIARDIPDPRRYARYMPRDEARVLLAAQRGGMGNILRYPDSLAPDFLRHLRAVGLAYLDDNGLTHFACAVRRVLVEDEAG